MRLTSRPDAEHQTGFRVRHAQTGIWLSAVGYLLMALRIAVVDRSPVPAVGVGVLAVLSALGLALPLRTLVRSRLADELWLGAVIVQWLALVGYVAVDPELLTVYPAVSALVLVYVGTGFPTAGVLGVGVLIVAGYPTLALAAGERDLPLIGSVVAIQAVNVALCAGIAGYRTRRDQLRVRAERRAEALLEQSADALLAVDADGYVRYQSPSASTVLGYRAGQLLGVELPTLFHPGDAAGGGRWLTGLATAPAGYATQVELRLRRADGGWIHAELAGANRLGDPDLDALVVNVRDVGARKDLEAQLTRQAFRDALTGLANRALFRDRVAHAVVRGRRSASTIALLLIDLDHFKLTNDAVGHARGDELLVAVAERLAGYVRPSDTLARLGGDEFALLVEERIDEDAAVTLGERLLEAARRPVTIGGRDVMVTASIGITVIKAGVYGAADAEELLRDADLAMYAAKSAGRDRCVLFDPAMHVEVLREAEQRADLESAFADDQFVVRYQPIVDLPTLRMVGVEALVRWQHPTRGVIGPTEFIPLAESTGLIVPLGRWVLHQACAQVVTWQRTLPNARRLRVSVNLSARQFQYPELVEDVSKILQRTGIDPAQVVLEITESLLMLDTEATVATLHQLKALGVRLAIDDFGTGYSSLSYLRRFPVDIIKIDRSFIDGITTGTDDATLAEVVVQLGRSLRLQTVAEGIETAEQSDRLRALGCEYGQGFLFARPVQASDIEPMLTGNNNV